MTGDHFDAFGDLGLHLLFVMHYLYVLCLVDTLLLYYSKKNYTNRVCARSAIARR